MAKEKEYDVIRVVKSVTKGAHKFTLMRTDSTGTEWVHIECVDEHYNTKRLIAREHLDAAYEELMPARSPELLNHEESPCDASIRLIKELDELEETERHACLRSLQFFLSRYHNLSKISDYMSQRFTKLTSDGLKAFHFPLPEPKKRKKGKA